MKKAWRKIIAACNSVINIAVMVFLVLLLIISCYALWDTNLVHTKAHKSQWESYKPATNNTLSFDELVQINSDVVGWVDIYGTGIDYPILYNKNTSYYLFRNAKGEPSSIGSIFMDGNCSPDFSDYNTILYGHHMDSHVMFGDIGLFNEKDYFTKHQFGNLFYGNKNYGLVIIGYIRTTSNDPVVYKTNISSLSNKKYYFNYLNSKSINWRDSNYNFNNRLLLLSTCSNAETEARQILITYITDETYENTFDDNGYIWPGAEDLEGWLGFPWTGWFVALIIIIMILVYILWQIDKKKKQKMKKKHNTPEINKYGTY